MTDNEITAPASEEVTTPDSGTSETPEQEPTAAVQEDSAPAETQTDQPGTSEDSFFDPQNVPEELKPAYKQMQAAFTKKTQEIAQARKEAEELQKRYQQYERYEPYAPILEEMLSGEKSQRTAPEMAALEAELKQRGYSDDAIEMMRIGADFTLRQLNQTLTSRDQQVQQQQRTQELEGKIAEAGKVDPRLSDSSLVYRTADGQDVSFGQIVERMVSADPNWQDDPVAATKRAIGTLDAMLGTAKVEGKTELTARARAKQAQFPASSASPHTSANQNESLSIHEAAKAARKELGM